jgi:hypothetical protein
MVHSALIFMDVFTSTYPTSFALFQIASVASVFDNFRIFSENPQVLAYRLRENLLAPHGLPAGTKLDRIDVSKLLDGIDRTKIPDIITNWGPMLKDNEHSTLMASFTEWHHHQKNASVSTLNEETKSEFVSRLIIDGRVSNVILNLHAVIV